MSKKNKTNAPASSQGEAGPASAPAEGRTGQPVPPTRAHAAPRPTASKIENPKPKIEQPAADLPNEAQIADHFLSELADSLPAEIEGVAPKTATRRTAQEPGDNEDGDNQEAPAARDLTESDPSYQSDQSDTTDTPDDAADEPGVDPESTNDPEPQDEAAPDEESLVELARLDDEALEAHAEDRKWPASYLKRVKKFTRQLRAAEARAATLEEELERREESGANPKPGTRNPEQVGAPSSRESQLAADIADHEEWLDQIDAVEPGGSLQVGERTFAPEQLRKARRKLETNLAALTYESTTIARQRAEDVRQGEAEALIRHPWLKDRSHPDTASIQNAMHAYPVLTGIPNVRALLADALTYRRLLEKAREKRGEGRAVNGTNGTNGHAAPKSPIGNPKSAIRGPARPAAVPMPAPRRGPDLHGRLAKVMETGNRHDAESIIMDLVEK